jgi:hypothetical protein
MKLLHKAATIRSTARRLGKLHFQITARGLERLEWLRAQKRTTLEEFFAPVLREK